MDPIKPVVLLIYAAVGIFLLCSAAGVKVRWMIPPVLPVRVVAGCAAVVIWVWFALHGYPFIVATALGLAVFAASDRAWRSRELLFGGAAVIVLAVSLAWWQGAGLQPRAWWHPVAFAAVLWCVEAGLLRAEGPGRSGWTVVLFLLFAVAAFALLANMAQFEPGSTALALLVHHQGAYVGPALDIRAGLVPFYDIPLQYGLGPTLTIAAVCGVTNYWNAMEWLIVVTSLLMGLLILRMALATRSPRGPAWRTTVTLVVFAGVFLWPGFSFLGSLQAGSPSVSGLRFLLVTLVAFLLFFDHTTLAAIALATAVLWSPETAVMSVAVFGLHETARTGFVKAAGKSALIAGGSMAGFVLVHHMVYGVWAEPAVMAEYILHVPGPLPIDLTGNFLFLAAALGLAAWNVFRPPVDPLAFRRDLVAAGLLFSATSYYLGRSHPNNICNLMPFIVLVLLRTLDGKAPLTMPHLPRLATAGLAAATAAIMLSPWDYPPFKHGFSTDAARLRQAAPHLDTDMIAVRSHIDNSNHLGIADLGHWNRNANETTLWTPLDPSCLWAFLPHDRRQLYIKRSAARLRMAGWVILGKEQWDWLDDFRVAYRVTDQRSYRFESAMSHQPVTYMVAHLVPLDVVGQVRAR